MTEDIKGEARCSMPEVLAQLFIISLKGVWFRALSESHEAWQ
jgi:hypothetical protein